MNSRQRRVRLRERWREFEREYRISSFVEEKLEEYRRDPRTFEQRVWRQVCTPHPDDNLGLLFKPKWFKMDPISILPPGTSLTFSEVYYGVRIESTIPLIDISEVVHEQLTKAEEMPSDDNQN